jgi:hypothetical protein
MKGLVNNIEENNGIQYIKTHAKLNKVILFPHLLTTNTKQNIAVLFLCL